MNKLLLVLLTLTVLTLACANTGGNSTTSSTTSASSSTSNSAAPAKTYDLDLKGQVARIADEGYDEALIKKNAADADKTITFEHLKKNASRYAGKPWAFTGKIVQIQEAGASTWARVALDGWGNKVVYVAAAFTTEFVENDRVYVVGYLAGEHSYTSQANWQISVPALAARAIIAQKDAGKYRTTGKAK